MARPDHTHWSLVLGAACGDPQRRESFAETYAPVIRSYFAARWRLPADHERVADAVQEVFLQCFKEGGALQRVDPERSGGFRAYLYGVASKVSLMQERSRARRRRSEHGESAVDLDRVARADATLSQVFDRAWAAMIAREARRRLAQRATDDVRMAERFRCLELQYAQELPPREIAVRLGLPAQRVYERLREARLAYRAALFEVLGEECSTSSRSELERVCREMVGLL